MYDPSIGQESLTKIDVIGVVIGHLIFGIAATLFLNWNWIPMNEKEKKRAKSLADIKKEWGWD